MEFTQPEICYILAGPGPRSALGAPGRVYVRKHVRDKYDPQVDEVDLLHANQSYAVVKYPERSDVIVSAWNVAPTATTLSNEYQRDSFPLTVQVQPE